MRRDCDLSRVWTRCMNTFVKRDRCTSQGFECHRARDVSESDQSLCTIHRQPTDSAHRLRSIEKRETFFYFQLQRRDLCALECYGGCEPFAFVENFSFADRGECEVCEGREITARTNASFFRNHRRHAFF